MLVTTRAGKRSAAVLAGSELTHQCLEVLTRRSRLSGTLQFLHYLRFTSRRNSHPIPSVAHSMYSSWGSIEFTPPDYMMTLWNLGKLARIPASAWKDTDCSWNARTNSSSETIMPPSIFPNLLWWVRSSLPCSTCWYERCQRTTILPSVTRSDSPSTLSMIMSEMRIRVQEIKCTSQENKY